MQEVYFSFHCVLIPVYVTPASFAPLPAPLLSAAIRIITHTCHSIQTVICLACSYLLFIDFATHKPPLLSQSLLDCPSLSVMQDFPTHTVWISCCLLLTHSSHPFPGKHLTLLSRIMSCIYVPCICCLLTALVDVSCEFPACWIICLKDCCVICSCSLLSEFPRVLDSEDLCDYLYCFLSFPCQSQRVPDSSLSVCRRAPTAWTYLLTVN